MSDNNKLLRGFFRCMAIGFLISCVKTDYHKMDAMQIVSTLFLTFMFNIIIGIWAGLTFIFWNLGQELYFIIKKKKNERYWQLYRLS